MADNVTIPAQGTGSTTPVIAADDCAGVQYQRVKLVDGTADSTALIPGDATNGLDVDVTRTANSNPLDYDTGAGTVSQGLVGIALPKSGGPVGVSSTNPLPTRGPDFTGAAGAAATIGAASAQIVAANASRLKLRLCNTSGVDGTTARNLTLGWGQVAVLYSGDTLAPGQSVEMDGFTGAVNGIASGSGCNVGIQEFT